MTKYQALILRFILFLAGAGIVLLSFFLINGDKELGRNDVFIWISIGVMYLVFFLPFFFSAVNTGNFSAKIPSLSMIWLGILLYTGASIIVIILLSRVIITLNAAIIIQAIIFFIYMVILYFAFFAVSYAGKTAEEEDEKKYYITKIKSKAGVLLLSVNKLPGEYENARNILIKSIDDIKYIFPVNNDTGGELEANILRSLDSLSQIIGNINSGACNSSLENAAIDLQSQVSERKLLRN